MHRNWTFASETGRRFFKNRPKIVCFFLLWNTHPVVLFKASWSYFIVLFLLVCCPNQNLQRMSSLKNPNLVGFLRKRGVKALKRNWKVRYCVVHERRLHWFKSQQVCFFLTAKTPSSFATKDFDSPNVSSNVSQERRVQAYFSRLRRE